MAAGSSSLGSTGRGQAGWGPGAVRYLDRGVERWAELPDQAGGAGSVALASGSSAAVREYEDKLKAIELGRRGLEKAEVAAKLQRSERWVQKWWRHEPQLLRRPHGAQDSVFQRTPLSGFRDVELTKGFAQDGSLFDTLAREVPWRQGKVMTRDPETGELVLRFDPRGRTIAAARKVADCPRGIGALDRLLQRAFAKADIRDPQARVVLNFYEDGQKGLNAHRHDFWTCLVSLGAPRVLLVDNRPHVMEDGDMIVFGTQMHGVPAMPDLGDGRISLVVFFYPDRDNLERRWLTVTSDGTGGHGGQDGDDEQDGNCSTEAAPTFCDDCRSGSVACATVPGSEALVALRTALDPSAERTRPYWRKTNAELQFLEYPTLPPATVYSVGCGMMASADFVAGLAQHGVEQLWDLRPPDIVRSAIHAGTCAGHFHPQRLREACRGRLRCYREWPIGTQAAGGLARHLFCSEEGLTLVYRLMREAQHAAVCLLGTAVAWREDDIRQSVGAALVRAGARVAHLAFSPGAPSEESEAHPAGFELPARLRPPAAEVPCDSRRADLPVVVEDEAEPLGPPAGGGAVLEGGGPPCGGTRWARRLPARDPSASNAQGDDLPASEDAATPAAPPELGGAGAGRRWGASSRQR